LIPYTNRQLLSEPDLSGRSPAPYIRASRPFFSLSSSTLSIYSSIHPYFVVPRPPSESPPDIRSKITSFDPRHPYTPTPPRRTRPTDTLLPRHPPLPKPRIIQPALTQTPITYTRLYFTIDSSLIPLHTSDTPTYHPCQCPECYHTLFFRVSGFRDFLIPSDQQPFGGNLWTIESVRLRASLFETQRVLLVNDLQLFNEYTLAVTDIVRGELLTRPREVELIAARHEQQRLLFCERRQRLFVQWALLVNTLATASPTRALDSSTSSST